MNSSQMRNELCKFYGSQWRTKVHNMTDAQVLAVYTKFKQEGKIK